MYGTTDFLATLLQHAAIACDLKSFISEIKTITRIYFILEYE